MPNVRYIRIEGKPPNPFVQALGVLVAGALFVLSIIVGGIFLAGLVGFVLLAMLVVYVRLWWLRRKLNAGAERPRPGGRRADDIVDAEYHVIDIASRGDDDRDD